ncbi:CinA family protein [Pseudomonas entomophila]|uniref:CinA family protein n=1 Tax=Pseudomonas entomophila TaxID=312306 RepID=UPI003EB99C75
MGVDPIERVLNYLKHHELVLTTAESCTAGRIVALLSEKPGTGCVLESGYVVYSPEAKQRLLGVRAQTIERCGLTSEEVAREMVAGALNDSSANVAIATTGVAGPEAQGDIAPGTVCFAWGFAGHGAPAIFSRTERFFGERQAVLHQATVHGLVQLMHFHQRWLQGERA